jgi:4-aminobutyrate aminotransferase-like enzyme
MLGVELDGDALGLNVTRAMLERGYLVLPAGARADVVQLSPPATISDAQLDGFLDAFELCLRST